ncbi:MAG: MFS transporter [Alphaproteobacteria bacterium]|nr:MFS transporter [Alphaproteobacteria bacterium]MBL6937661.1 MFS transporter [Alphaproteobacteria bacterium]MBL7098999.1 MFS transporter [Alphaproteobacteria bacterium]
MTTIHEDGLPTPQRYWAIATIALGIVMAVMDSAIANVALPTIGIDLRADPALSIWIVNGYQLAITISLLPLAALGDIIGYRRIYVAGLILFTIASLLCAVARDLPMLAIARVVQGFGGAGIMAVNSALIRFIYPHRLLGRGLSINTLIVAVSAAAGPTVAAGILSVATWPWLFAVNIPFGFVAIVIALRALPFTPRAKHSFDIPGALLVALMFGLLIGSIDAFGHGGSGVLFIVELAATIVIGAIMVRREATAASPMLPVDLMRIPIFALSIGTSICSFAGQMLALVSLPFLLQSEMHFTAVETGLLMTPWPIAIALVSPVAGRLADRYPAGILGAIGLIVFGSGLFALAQLPAHPSIPDIAWRMVLAGAGFGLFQSPNNRAMIGSTPRERSGGASGMLGTARLLGQTIGAALVALLFARFPAHGTVTSLYVGVGFALVAAAVSSLRLFDRTGQAPAR